LDESDGVLGTEAVVPRHDRSEIAIGGFLDAAENALELVDGPLNRRWCGLQRVRRYDGSVVSVPQRVVSALHQSREIGAREIPIGNHIPGRTVHVGDLRPPLQPESRIIGPR